MRFGLALPQYDFSLPGVPKIEWSRVRDAAQKAEGLGYSSVWLSDHLFLDLARYGGSDQNYDAMECFTTISALATSTKTIGLGTLVVCNDLRPPTLVAKMAATIAFLSKGRLTLGMGAGWYEPEFEAAGVRFPPAGERVSRLQESVRIVKGMLRNETFSFAGNHYEVQAAKNIPSPPQELRPRVIVGGKGDRVARIAGRWADGYNAVWAWTPDAYRDRLLKVEEGRSRRKTRENFNLTVGLYALPGSSEADLKQRWDKYVKASPIDTSKHDLATWGGDKLMGTPDQIAERVRQFEALGVEEVILGFGFLPFQIADDSAVEEFAREVFPRVA